MNTLNSGMKFTLGAKAKATHDEQGRPWYDTAVGIQEALLSLDGFTALVFARRDAGYVRNESMNEFFLFGRYFLDTVGNCGKLHGWIPKDKFPNLPDVMTKDDFWALVKMAVGDNVSVSTGMNSDLPSGGVTCPICKKGWSIHNCHDTVVKHNHETFSLAEFVGKTLGDVKASYSARTDAHYMMQSDCLIRNDRFIDLSAKYPDTQNDWEKSIKKNERGWVSENEGIDDAYVIQEGDEGFFNMSKYFHSKCRHLDLASTTETSFREIFAKAGFMFSVMHHLPNGYTHDSSGPPWFTVETEVGSITLGWRKSVIIIDWSETPHAGKDILQLFAAEDVTKDKTYIHAWSKEKAVEYLSKIREALSV